MLMWIGGVGMGGGGADEPAPEAETRYFRKRAMLSYRPYVAALLGVIRGG